MRSTPTTKTTPPTTIPMIAPSGKDPSIGVCLEREPEKERARERERERTV